MSKTKKIIGIVVLVIVLLTVSVGAIFFFTNWFDTFRSDRTLFFTYLNQNMDGLPSFDMSVLERANTESSTTTARVSWEFGGRGAANEFGDYLELVNNLSVAVHSRTDMENERMAIEAEVEYRGDDLVSLEAIVDRDQISLGLHPILDQFLTLENSNLNELFVELFGADAEFMPDSIDLDFLFDRQERSTLDWADINSRYLAVAEGAIRDRNFSSSRETLRLDGSDVNVNAYTLRLNQVDLLDIVIAMLEYLENDEELLGHVIETIEAIPEEIMEEILEQLAGEFPIGSNVTIGVRTLQALIEQMRNAVVYQRDNFERDDLENVLEITVFERRGTTVMTRIIINDEFRLDIRRETSRNEVNFTFIAFARAWDSSTASNTGRFEETGRFDLQVTKDGNRYTFALELNDYGTQVSLRFTVSDDLTYIAFNFGVEERNMNVNLIFEVSTEIGNTEVNRPRNSLVLNTATDDDIIDLIEDVVDGLERLAGSHRGQMRSIIEDMIDNLILELEMLFEGPEVIVDDADQTLIATKTLEEDGVVAHEEFKINFAGGRPVSGVITYNFEIEENAEEFYMALTMVLMLENVTITGTTVIVTLGAEELDAVVDSMTIDDLRRELEREGYIVVIS
ncbi:MAG: hypothetical protein FWC79_03625 [Oscillospiraceae bacterium]|nr:hypothetical protein [Oscillospiraceae bacterium]